MQTRGRVLLCVRTLGSGGTERQAAAMAMTLGEYGYQTQVCCGEDGGFRAAELRERGIPIFVNPVQGLYRPATLRAAWRLRQYLRQERIGLVHTFDFPMNIFAAPVARLAGVKVLTSQRCFRDTIPPKYHPLLRIAHGMAHGVVTNSHAVSAHLVSDYGVDRSRIEYCPNGLDLQRFEGGVRVAEPGFEGRLVIGTASVLRPEKGLGDLIEAFAAADPVQRNLALLVVGSGPEKQALEALATRLGVGQYCRFISDTRDVGAWMRKMDVFVLPSHSEALSNSLMEAMACGCAVIASEVGGNPELVSQQETGLLFPARQAAALAMALRRMADEPELRHRLALAGEAKMRASYSLEAAAARLAAIYDRFILPGKERQ